MKSYQEQILEVWQNHPHEPRLALGKLVEAMTDCWTIARLEKEINSSIHYGGQVDMDVTGRKAEIAAILKKYNLNP